MFAGLVPAYLMLSFIVVAFEKSDRYVEAAAVTVVAVPLLVYVYVLPGSRTVTPGGAVGSRPRRRSDDGAGRHLFTYTRRAVARGLGSNVVWAALLLVVVGAIAGATEWRLVQYGIVGARTRLPSQ